MTQMPALDDPQLETLEIDLLLEAVYRRFGYDFRGYHRDIVRERVRMLMRSLDAKTISALQGQVLHETEPARQLLNGLAGKPVGLFSEPSHFLALRRQLSTWLGNCPSPRIWIADCLSAEQACSVAILLAEEQSHHRCRIFATTPNDFLLDSAKTGIVSAERMAEYENNYRLAGGRGKLSDYFEWRDDMVELRQELRHNIVWAQYCLATDASFNEFDLIICRNLRDFGPLLRRRVLRLLHDSLATPGMLSVDDPSMMDVPPFTRQFQALDRGEGLYRRLEPGSQ